MKNQKQTPNASLANVNQPPSSPPLKQAVEEFLKTKEPFLRPKSLKMFRCALNKLLASCGHLPVVSVTSDQVYKAVVRPDSMPHTQRMLVFLMKRFFWWCSSQGYLPPHSPTVADALHITAPQFEPPIITPAQLTNLFRGIDDVECRLCLVMSAFAGIRRREFAGLDWDHISPGLCITISSNRERCKGPDRAVLIMPVLESWLRPFYGSRGPVLSGDKAWCTFVRLAGARDVRLSPHALRNAYRAYHLALALRLHPSMLHSSLHHIVTEEEARKFFSLTPEGVGIKNWPEIVANYLKVREAKPTANSGKIHLRNSSQSNESQA